MSVCEMCGGSGSLVNADVEGVELKVCQKCTKYGKVKKSFSSQNSPYKKSFKRQEGPALKIVGNYSSLIRTAREQKGMKQEDFAKFLNERESVVSKWEQGILKPRIDIARKIGRVLHINLIQKEAEKKPFEQEKSKADGMTLGDFIKVRKRN
jgi:putative transcription factor